MSRALALVALTHLRYMPSEHPFMLELASSPLMKLPCSPPRSIPAFGRLAGKWRLLELIGQRQRRQHFGTLQTNGGLRAVGVGSGTARAEAPEPPLSCTCERCGRRLAAQLAAARMRAVRKGSAWLEALAWPTLRAQQGSSKLA